MKTDIRSLSLDALIETFGAMGQPAYRARQVWEWLWKKWARDFQEMTNLPISLRLQLAEVFLLLPIKIDTQQISTDGTIKVRFVLPDNHFIEGVLIPSGDRMTACVSSQVGCSLTCKFCATGYMGRKRNLSSGEIYDQALWIHQLAMTHYQKPLTNIVFMGMGEPLLNYKNVIFAIDRLSSEDGWHFSAKRITVSTAGIAKMIRQLADDGVRFHLALSLHAADDHKRNQVMPINESNHLDVLIEALQYFAQKRKESKITFEYILLDGFNDQPEDVVALKKLCKRLPVKVNVIEYNPIEQANFQKTHPERRKAFMAELEAGEIITKVRLSRGKDIDAACGQLAIRGKS